MKDMLTRRKMLALGGASLTLPFLPFDANAQQAFPERPVRVIVPRAAGGPLDVVARLWGEQVKSSLNTVVVENMGGGGGAIGTHAVVRAQPDGHTIGVSSTGDIIINPLIRKNLGYDPVRDLAPVYIVANSSCGIAVNPNVEAKDLAQLVALAKENSKPLSYGSAGAGSMTHLAGELFKQVADVPSIVHVPYKGSGPGFADLVAGHIPIMVFTVSNSALQMHRAGKIRILAITSNQRLKAVPDVPTAVESGYPAFIAQSFFGLFAPAATPQAILTKIADTTRTALSEKSLQDKFESQGFEPVLDSAPQSAAAFVKNEVVRWQPVVTAAGMAS